MKSFSILLLAALLILFVSIVAVPVSAETAPNILAVTQRAFCRVPTLAHPTIQLAHDDAGCTEIQIAAGTYGDPISITRSISIFGISRTGTIITNEIYVEHPTNETINVLLETMTVQNSPRHGIFARSGARLTANNITVTGNTDTGIRSLSSSPLTLSDCEVSHNKSGVVVPSGAINMTNCSINNNLIRGGMSVRFGFIRDSMITDNVETAIAQKGGGISIRNTTNGSLTIENSTIHANTCDGPDATSNFCDGGGIALLDGSLIVRDSTVTQNVADRFGGGIHIHNQWTGSAIIENSTISNNTANDSGGGISVAQPTIIQNSVIEGNTAYADAPQNDNGVGAGGGIYVYDSSLEMSDTTVRDNRALPLGDALGISSGGGLYVLSSAVTTVTVTSSTFSGNFAHLDGGGAYVTAGTTFMNVTVAENKASRNGGGIFGEFPGFINNSTIADNIADFNNDGVGDGGGLAGNMRVFHTWIGHNRDNTTAGTQHHDCAGSTVSLGFSLLREIGTCDSFAAFASDQVGNTAVPLNINPILPLADHGGPTETIALETSSLAVDAGSAECAKELETDQRGAPRPEQDGNMDGGGDDDRCDIGAFEVAPDYAPTAVAVGMQEAAAGSRDMLFATLVTLLLLTGWSGFRPKSTLPYTFRGVS